ncbi:hypothetical protein AB0J80_24785 [Actinoplanes sp. NPDC049548]|uniref:hypothetical protein n=1 Tax=Actinoplanes sp. NPDC049548 TaxID=3155152 RepID=UPI003430F214
MSAAGPMRRAYAALAFWYALLWCLPGALAVLANGPGPGDRPGFSPGGDRWQECTGHFGCPTEPIDVGGVLGVAVLVLAPSLLVTVPLCGYLARKWSKPAWAGFAAAAAGVVLSCAGGLIFMAA